MSNFVECSDKFVPDDWGGLCEISDELKGRFLDESIKSGFEIDTENNIYIRKGYGALVGFCPNIFNSISEVRKVTKQEMDEYFNLISKKRKLINRLNTLKNKILKIEEEPYYTYEKLINDGYQLIIGPGGMINGEFWEKAVYCLNYLDILNSKKEHKKSNQKKNGCHVVYETDNLDNAISVSSNDENIVVIYKSSNRNISPTLTLNINGKSYTKYNPEYIEQLKKQHPNLSDNEIIELVKVAIEENSNKNKVIVKAKKI